MNTPNIRGGFALKIIREGTWFVDIFIIEQKTREIKQ
jgi:hypothetical protein